MKFSYTYQNTALELWQLSMYYMYGSLAGVCNVIFTAALFSLTAAKWNLSGWGTRLPLVIGCLLFPVIQPLLVYGKAKRQAADICQDTKAEFDESGIHVTVGDQSQDIRWSAVRKVSKKPTMVIIFSDTTHGFVLSNRVLGEERNAFYEYVTSKIKK